MKSLENGIEKQYKEIQEVNTKEREKVESGKSKIWKVAAVVGIAAGAIGSVVVAGPFGLGLIFAEAGSALLGGLAAGGAAGGATAGAGVGFGIKKLVPRKWFGESSVLKKTMKSLKESVKSIFLEDIPTGTPDTDRTTTYADSTATEIGTEVRTANVAAMPNNAALTIGNVESTMRETVESHLYGIQLTCTSIIRRSEAVQVSLFVLIFLCYHSLCCCCYSFLWNIFVRFIDR